jgi:hypothetical protein
MNDVNMRLRSVRAPYTNGLPEQLVDSLVRNGQCGVQIFFAVSGFLITSTALRRWGSLFRVSIRDFYLLRFARIACKFQGTRYDAGDRLGFLKATVEYALRRKDLGGPFREYLKGLKMSE